MFAGVVCHVSLFLLIVIQKEMTDQGVQTDASEELSDRPSQIIQDNLNSMETITLEDTFAAISSRNSNYS
jgi:hypothetical protein